jgi:hypothetical protein
MRRFAQSGEWNERTNRARQRKKGGGLRHARAGGVELTRLKEKDLEGTRHAHFPSHQFRREGTKSFLDPKMQSMRMQPWELPKLVSRMR